MPSPLLRPLEFLKQICSRTRHCMTNIKVTIKAGNTIKMSIPVIPTYARPVEAVCNKRESSEEQLRAGERIVGFWGIHRQTLHFTKLKKSSLKRYLCFWSWVTCDCTDLWERSSFVTICSWFLELGKAFNRPLLTMPEPGSRDKES